MKRPSLTPRQRHTYCALSALVSSVVFFAVNPEVWNTETQNRQVMLFGAAFLISFLVWEIGTWVTRGWTFRDMQRPDDDNRGQRD